MITDDEKMNNGFISLWRSLMNWEWYTEVNTCKLFIHCLLKANHKDNKWRNIIIKRGSFITSIKKLSIETGLSEQNIRTSLKNLKLTNELTCQSTSQYSIITVKKYEFYQNANKQLTSELTNNQQTANMRLTTNNNDNNDNNEIINNSIISSSCNFEEKNAPAPQEEISDINPDRLKDLENWYGEYRNVHLTKDQYNNLETFILNDKALNEIIEELSENIACKRDKAKPYDEKYPAMHYIALKKYWQFKFNQTPVKNSETAKQTDVSKELDRIFEKMENKNK